MLKRISKALFSTLSLIIVMLPLNLWAIAGLSQSQNEIVSLEQAFQLHATHDAQTLSLHYDVNPCCYLYQDKLQIWLLEGDENKTSLLPTVLPRATLHEEPDLEDELIYPQPFSIAVHLTSYLQSTPQDTLCLKVDYQGCSASGFCYPPVSKWITLSVKDQKIDRLQIENKAPAKPITAPQIKKQPATDTQDKGNFWVKVAPFFLFGILLGFTPCVLPMIPILFTVIVGEKHLNTRKAFWLSSCYALSMATTYAIAGIIAGLAGKNLQAAFQNPVAITLFALLFTYLGLLQIGALKFTLHHSLRLKEILSHLHAKQESGTYVGAVVMGVLAALISSPCITPPLVVALGFITKSGDVTLGGSALMAMGLGMGSVLVLIGTVGGKYMPKSGPWMQHVNHFFALAMFGLSIWLLARLLPGPLVLILWALLCVFAAWCLKTFKKRGGLNAHIGMLLVIYALILTWGAFQGQSDPLKPLKRNPWQDAAYQFDPEFDEVTSVAEFELAKTKARAEDKPIMLVFHAHWCALCMQMERNLWHRTEIADSLADWYLIRADVTANDQNAKQLLKMFDLVGPPALILLDDKASELPTGRKTGKIDVQELQRHLADHLPKAQNQ